MMLKISTALILPLLTRVERVTVTPSLSFCWYPSPTYHQCKICDIKKKNQKLLFTSLLLLILARTAAPSGRTYFAPIPGENIL